MAVGHLGGHFGDTGRVSQIQVQVLHVRIGVGDSP